MSQDVEFIWDYIKAAIYNALNLFIPKIQLKSHKQPVWFNLVIRHKLHCTHTLRRKHNKHPTENNKEKLEQAENELQQLMINEKANYETKLIHMQLHVLILKVTKYFATYLP